MTREEVAKACGLEPPNEYIKRTGKGHTTAMLCEAVASASLGKRAIIRAYNQRYALQLMHEAMRMARQCRIGVAAFEAHDFEWDPVHGTRGLRNSVVLCDHYSGR